MGSFLFKLPLFSTICKVLGHFPVYFLKAEDGKFTLNQVRRWLGIRMSVFLPPHRWEDK